MAKEKPHLNVVFIGHVDHGKSTTVGRLMYDSGVLPEQELRKLRDRKLITPATYRKLYRNAKGGMFNNVRQLNRHIKDKELLRRGR